jgi:hypothetical protein
VNERKETAIVDPRQWGLRDHLLDGWHCTCGERLWPDCDVSSRSVAEEFERHLIERHGCTQSGIDAVRALGNGSQEVGS